MPFGNKITLYFFSIIQGILYTPVILSFAFFIIAIPILIQGNNTNTLLRLLPSGNFTDADIITIYGKFAFGASLIIAIAETVFRKQFKISVKKKTLFAGLFLLLGYAAIAGLLIYKANIQTGTALTISLALFIFSALSLFASALLTILTNFISKLSKSS